MNEKTEASDEVPSSYTFERFTIPAYMIPGLKQYYIHGRKPGGFLTAVLENNLERACLAADRHNAENLPAYINFMHTNFLNIAWGSREKVEAWMKMGGLEGRVNHYDETRKLSDGSIKNTLTGEVTQPTPPHITHYGETS